MSRSQLCARERSAETGVYIEVNENFEHHPKSLVNTFSDKQYEYCLFTAKIKIDWILNRNEIRENSPPEEGSY